jgi:uncharacterized protein (TIGR00251 family)
MSLMIEIRVAPSAGKQQCILDKSGRLKCYLKSPAERGLANQELIELLARALKVPQKTIRIVAGATARTKLVCIEHIITVEKVLAALGIEKQLNIKM